MVTFDKDKDSIIIDNIPVTRSIITRSTHKIMLVTTAPALRTLEEDLALMQERTSGAEIG